MRNYGESLREFRLSKGKSFKELEKETGISDASLCRWEQGKVLPSIYFCEKLADYYGVTLDELIGRDFETKN
ncbi:MAG: helix-turn-helix transcriptional regulator [Clostridia bacterium]|nr:helix-turn-helix transcriptional regulator [Clostridia bacterium]